MLDYFGVLRDLMTLTFSVLLAIEFSMAPNRVGVEFRMWKSVVILSMSYRDGKEFPRRVFVNA